MSHPANTETILTKEVFESVKPAKKENLKQRAYLNSLSGMLDFSFIQLTGFIINPFIVAGLGTSMYGIWQVIGQMTGYTKMADTRATQVLKWTLAGKRNVVEVDELRSDLTTAMVVTAISLPFVLLIGAVISWYAPVITQADPKYYDLIRITCAILISGLAINKFFDLFEAVLGGMNLGYKRMGFRAGIVVVGGLLKIYIISQGFGLIGLALVQVFLSLVTGYVFYRVVKKHVWWFRFGKTNMTKVKSFGKLSGWYMAFTTLKMVLMNSDKIILGFLIGPLYVAKYALTMFTSTAVQGAVTNVITGITPGISTLYGEGNYDKVREARKLVLSLAWTLSAAIGCTILMINRSFVNLWVGPEHYAGNIENLLILLVTVQVIFFQIDSYMINVTLNMKRKVKLSAWVGVLSTLLGFLLIREFQIVGLCISLLVGRLIYTFGFPMLLKKQMQDKFTFFSKGSIRPVLSIIILYLLATLAGYEINITNWLTLLLAAVLIFSVAGIIYWFVGINASERREITLSLSKIKVLKFK
ncbi:MAG: lipopolysaccharide biosynthesis protein [Chitinophagaceae bacterium]